MPSQSLRIWRTENSAALDEIAHAHAAVGGSVRGRRYATQQINQAYAVLLSSRFQRMCRDLHSEATDYLASRVGNASIQDILRENLTYGRKLDTGNPNPGNVGSDFNRLGVDFWNEVRKLDRRNARRQQLLGEMNLWRNAIAHQDFRSPALGGAVGLRLDHVRLWRSVCDALAGAFDDAIGPYLGTVIGTRPW